MSKYKFVKRKRPVSSVSYPVIGEAGKTGTWRTLRPVMDINKCTVSKKGKLVCLLCWLYCPEACISRTIPPKIDYDYCKGCLVCVNNCPTGALEVIEESDVKEGGV
ncbi:MAG: 4Fe-4S binding protein [Candidatus Helarchaeota archaeon]